MFIGDPTTWKYMRVCKLKSMFTPMLMYILILIVIGIFIYFVFKVSVDVHLVVWIYKPHVCFRLEVPRDTWTLQFMRTVKRSVCACRCIGFGGLLERQRMPSQSPRPRRAQADQQNKTQHFVPAISRTSHKRPPQRSRLW